MEARRATLASLRGTPAEEEELRKREEVLALEAMGSRELERERSVVRHELFQEAMNVMS